MLKKVILSKLPKFDMKLVREKVVFAAVIGVAILFSLTTVTILFSLFFSNLYYNVATILVLLLVITVFIMFLEYFIIITDVLRYILRNLSLTGKLNVSHEQLKHLGEDFNLSLLNTSDLPLIFTLLASITTKTIIGDKSFYGINSITILLLCLSIFSIVIIEKVCGSYGRYRTALNNFLTVNGNFSTISLPSNVLDKALRYSRNVFIARFAAVLIVLELFTLNLLNGYLNNLPILEFFFGLSIALTLYFTFKITFQIEALFQQPLDSSQTNLELKYQKPDKSDFQEKNSKGVSILEEKNEKKDANNKGEEKIGQSQKLSLQSVPNPEKVPAENEKEFKVNSKKPLTSSSTLTFPVEGSKKNFKVVAVKDIEEKRENEITKLVEEIRSELKKLQEKSKSQPKKSGSAA